MSSITASPIEIHTSPEEVPSIPPWFAEVVLLARYFSQQGYLDAISQRVRLARGRAATFDVLDFVAVLLGYAVSGEPTLEAFFDRLAPFAHPLPAPRRARPACWLRLRQPYAQTLMRQN